MISSTLSKPISTQLNSTVNIYLRNYKKQAILVSTTTPTKKSELQHFIADKFHLPPNKLAYFLNGKRIDEGKGEIQLKEKSIVHVVHLQRTKYESIKIILRTATSPPQRMLATVKSNSIIKSIFESHIQPFMGKNQREVFLAYLARPLNIFKSFEEQFVEHECQIIILQFKSSKIQELSILNSKFSKHPSVASTMMLGMPVRGGRSINDPSKHKTSKSINKNYLPQMQKVQEIQWGQYSPNNLKTQDEKLEPAAPHQEAPILESDNAAPSQYCGFDPHQDKINFTKKEQTKKQEIPPTKSQPESSNPENNQFSLKQKDTLYIAAPYMQEIENFSAGAVSEFKQAFYKKKSTSGKESKG